MQTHARAMIYLGRDAVMCAKPHINVYLYGCTQGVLDWKKKCVHKVTSSCNSLQIILVSSAHLYQIMCLISSQKSLLIVGEWKNIRLELSTPNVIWWTLIVNKNGRWRGKRTPLDPPLRMLLSRGVHSRNHELTLQVFAKTAMMKTMSWKIK